MASYGTTYESSGQAYGGPSIQADSHDHAQVRMEFAIAMGWIDDTSELAGELVETVSCDDDTMDAMNPVGRI